MNPRLIYASISGYGQTGPDRDKGGFDLIAQGVSGIMSITGEPGGAPVKAGVPLTDLGAGLFALVGILAAVAHRHRTRRGPARRYVAGRCRRRAVGVGSHRVFRRHGRAAGARLRAPDDCAVSGDPLRATATSRWARRTSACSGGCARCSTTRSGRRCPSSLDSNAPPAQPPGTDRSHRGHHRGRAVRALARAVRSQRHPVRPDQRLRAGLRRSARSSRARWWSKPIIRRSGSSGRWGRRSRLSATPALVGRAAPRLGEHTVEVLREAGFSDIEIDQLQRRGWLAAPGEQEIRRVRRRRRSSFLFSLLLGALSQNLGGVRSLAEPSCVALEAVRLSEFCLATDGPLLTSSSCIDLDDRGVSGRLSAWGR